MWLAHRGIVKPTIICCDQRQIQHVGIFEKMRLAGPLYRQAVALQLNIQPAGKNLGQYFQTLPRQIGPTIASRIADKPAQCATTQHDQTIAIAS